MGTNNLHTEHEASGRFNPFCTACVGGTGPVVLDRRNDDVQRRLWADTDRKSRRLTTPITALSVAQ